MNPVIPSEIKIGNRTIPVTLQPNLSIDGQTVMGYYSITNPAIFIDANLKPLAIVETFWHELMHAVFDYTRFNVEVQMEMAGADNIAEAAYNIEERSAESFAKVFLQVIQDNNIANITA